METYTLSAPTPKGEWWQFLCVCASSRFGCCKGERGGLGFAGTQRVSAIVFASQNRFVVPTTIWLMMMFAHYLIKCDGPLCAVRYIMSRKVMWRPRVGCEFTRNWGRGAWYGNLNGKLSMELKAKPGDGWLAAITTGNLLRDE